MSMVTQYHREAMSFVDAATDARRRSDHVQARRDFAAAFDLERRAAELVPATGQSEPTRSILYRSAAALAMECGELRGAEKLIAVALAGDPPDDLADELRDLLNRVHLRMHTTTARERPGPPRKYITIREVADHFDVTTGTVRNWIRKGVLDAPWKLERGLRVVNVFDGAYLDKAEAPVRRHRSMRRRAHVHAGGSVGQRRATAPPTAGAGGS